MSSPADINRWDFKTKEYLPYDVPAEVKLELYTPNMEELVPCAACFNSLPYGETFTSRRLHTSIGLGWPVCNDCYEKEWRDQRESA